MQDVIFAGTENRKPVSYAYVAITMDNSDHLLPLDYEEVTTPFMCQSNVFDYVFIKITYDEYSDTKFFGDKIKMNVIYNDETSMIISLDFLISDAIKQIKLS